MNEVSFSFLRLLVILLWISVICIAAHFLHDLQPGHNDLFNTSASVCSQAIHLGLLIIILPAVSLQLLITRAPFFPRLSTRFAILPVPIPPPIH